MGTHPNTDAPNGFTPPPGPEVSGLENAPVVERRTHRRSRLLAQAELRLPDSDTPIMARLITSSSGGCLLELGPEVNLPIGTNVSISFQRGTESFKSEARVNYILPRRGVGLVFTRTEPHYLQTLVTWVMESAWSASDRRASQRRFLDLPVTVAGQFSGGGMFREKTRTVKVSAEGCSVLLAAPVEKGQPISLLNPGSGASIACVVVRTGNDEEPSSSRREVGLAFLLPNQDFWQVSFPPLHESRDPPPR